MGFARTHDLDAQLRGGDRREARFPSAGRVHLYYAMFSRAVLSAGAILVSRYVAVFHGSLCRCDGDRREHEACNRKTDRKIARDTVGSAHSAWNRVGHDVLFVRPICDVDRGVAECRLYPLLPAL